MRLTQALTRTIGIFLSLAIASPGPAYGLRQAGLEENPKSRGELKRALTIRSGLEEKVVEVRNLAFGQEVTDGFGHSGPAGLKVNIQGKTVEFGSRGVAEILFPGKPGRRIYLATHHQIAYWILARAYDLRLIPLRAIRLLFTDWHADDAISYEEPPLAPLSAVERFIGAGRTTTSVNRLGATHRAVYEEDFVDALLKAGLIASYDWYGNPRLPLMTKQDTPQRSILDSAQIPLAATNLGSIDLDVAGEDLEHLPELFPHLLNLARKSEINMIFTSPGYVKDQTKAKLFAAALANTLIEVKRLEEEGEIERHLSGRKRVELVQAEGTDPKEFVDELNRLGNEALRFVLSQMALEKVLAPMRQRRPRLIFADLDRTSSPDADAPADPEVLAEVQALAREVPEARIVLLTDRMPEIVQERFGRFIPADLTERVLVAPVVGAQGMGWVVPPEVEAVIDGVMEEARRRGIRPGDPAQGTGSGKVLLQMDGKTYGIDVEFNLGEIQAADLAQSRDNRLELVALAQRKLDQAGLSRFQVYSGDARSISIFPPKDEGVRFWQRRFGAADGEVAFIDDNGSRLSSAHSGLVGVASRGGLSICCGTRPGDYEELPTDLGIVMTKGLATGPKVAAMALRMIRQAHRAVGLEEGEKAEAVGVGVIQDREVERWL
ncbi:MAG: hypothetical protein HYZ90_02165 [Candidatus Omnitrophica bacterium]|nr:hypothetical protein [Candidatus Omnitrophota bacterium]